MEDDFSGLADSISMLRFAVHGVSKSQDTVLRRMSQVDHTVTTAADRQQVMDDREKEMDYRQKQMEKSIIDLTRGQEELLSEMAELRTDVTSVMTEVSAIKSDMDRRFGGLERDVADLKSDIDRRFTKIEGHVAAVKSMVSTILGALPKERDDGHDANAVSATGH
jgi:DNA-binding FrmR family transcriptional regulator